MNHQIKKLSLLLLLSFMASKSNATLIDGIIAEPVSRGCGEGCGPYAQCWVFNEPKNAVVTYQCCKKGYMPTGETNPSKGRCAPMEDRCAPEFSNNPFYCSNRTPFKVCCPAGSSAVCRQDKRGNQCENNIDVENPGEENLSISVDKAEISDREMLSTPVEIE